MQQINNSRPPHPQMINNYDPNRRVFNIQPNVQVRQPHSINFSPHPANFSNRQQIINGLQSVSFNNQNYSRFNMQALPHPIIQNQQLQQQQQQQQQQQSNIQTNNISQNQG